MKRPPNKADIRAELERQLADYRSSGGAINEIPRGVSGRYDNQNPFSQLPDLPRPQERTPVNDVVQALDARKHPNKSKPGKRPKKKLLRDDFGEPLRWVWEE